MMDIGRDSERMRDYVVGRMSEEERSTFEDRLARDPELVRELEQSVQLEEGLVHLKAQGYFDQAAAGVPRGSRDWVSPRSLRLWARALAAAAIAGVALFLWMQQRPTSPGILRASLQSGVAGTLPPVAARFTFVAMRTGSSPDLAFPSQGVIELRAQPAAHATVSRFRVTLVREEEGVAGAASLGTLTGVALGADGYVHAYVDARRLTSASYRLRLEPDAGAGSAADTFGFRLRAAGTGPVP